MKLTRDYLKILKPERIYSRMELAKYSQSIDQDLASLLESGVLLKPKRGQYALASGDGWDDAQVVARLLDGSLHHLIEADSLLMYGVDLECPIVLNRKRHEFIEIGGREYNFIRPTNGFPSQLSPEFMIVLALNLRDTERLFFKAAAKIKFSKEMLLKSARRYGQKSVRIFLERYYQQEEQREKVQRALADIGAPFAKSTEKIGIAVSKIIIMALEWGRIDARINSVLPYVIYKNREELDQDKIWKAAKDGRNAKYLAYLYELVDFSFDTDLSAFISSSVRKDFKFVRPLLKGSRKLPHLKDDSNPLAHKWGFYTLDQPEYDRERLLKWRELDAR